MTAGFYGKGLGVVGLGESAEYCGDFAGRAWIEDARGKECAGSCRPVLGLRESVSRGEGVGYVDFKGVSGVL
jgi:hypothetical protein